MQRLTTRIGVLAATRTSADIAVGCAIDRRLDWRPSIFLMDVLTIAGSVGCGL